LRNDEVEQQQQYKLIRLMVLEQRHRAQVCIEQFTTVMTENPILYRKHHDAELKEFYFLSWYQTPNSKFLAIENEI